jgi:hypothetical protein
VQTTSLHPIAQKPEFILALRTSPTRNQQEFLEHGWAYDNGIECAYTMVHRTPQAAQNQHIVKKQQKTVAL